MRKLSSNTSGKTSGLARYRAKRDFQATSEPKGRRGKAKGAAFVVQKHDARRLHYDLRLEMDGVLKSWAVTRGPSLVSGKKRLAVHVEDHPLDYAGYEGVIPQGSYGAGTVIVWDRGTWRAEGDARKDYARGRLTFALEGERLKGRWHLVRTKPRGGKEQWLLIKSDDAFAQTKRAKDVLAAHVGSVVTGRTNADLAAATPVASGSGNPERPAKKARAEKASARPTTTKTRQGGKKGPLPDFVAPCLATLSDKAPAGDKWLHEIKLDGYRVEARLARGRARLLTRSGLDWTERFGPVAEAVAALDAEAALLDGEIVVEDGGGISRFSELQADLSAGRTDRFRYHIFDLLHRDGQDLRGEPLSARKAALAELLASLPTRSVLRLSEHTDDDGPAMARHACRMGLEGIVSKRADRPYRSGRHGDWLKIKCSARQELVIAGYLPSTVSRGRVGSLVLGAYRGKDLIHVGRAGTGYTDAVARDLFERLEPLRRATSPFAEKLPREALRGGVRFVEPKLVAEVELRDWTADGSIRHAAYKGLREDKDPRQVVRETAMTKTASQDTQKPAAKTPVRRRAAAPTVAAGVRLTHPDRVLWPETGLTKEGLAQFYESVADHALPEIVDRPLSLVRCPDGIAKACFFQKHAWAGLDEKAVRRIPIDGEDFLAVRNLSGLMALVQANVLEIHPWGSKVRTLEKPDRIIFDLDPGPGVVWPKVVEAALDIRDRLAELDFRSFCKTSGGKGLHVVVPLKPRADWDAVKGFAERFAKALAADDPGRFVATVSKQARRGKILVDYLRNGRGATAVAAYSTRARAGAPVSTPVTWEELPGLAGGDQFRVETLPGRLANLKADPWRDFSASARALRAKD